MGAKGELLPKGKGIDVMRIISHAFFLINTPYWVYIGKQ